MKTKLSVWIILSVLVIILAACRTDQATPEEVPPTKSSPIEEQHEGETAYPLPELGEIEDSYPIQEAPLPPPDAAYPITEEDLQQLIRTWTLESYSDAGVSQETEAKTLTFNADGTYEVTTEGVTSTGTWSTRLGAFESTLFLESDAGDIQTFEIVDLTEGRLHLSTVRDGIRVDEEYLPVD